MALAAPLLCDEARGEDLPTARAVFVATPPKIDGVLDDPAWRAAPPHGGFRERHPRLGEVPPDATTFYVVFDTYALYFGVRCVDSRPELVRARTVQRDSFALFSDDAISIKLDPQNDRRTTIGFVLNAASGQLDYRGLNESEFRVEFDPIWQGEARRVPDGWSAEFRIPFESLRIDPSRPPARVGLNLSRDHSRRNATYDWALLRPPFGPIAASRYGSLVGLDDLPRRITGGARARAGMSYAITPYVVLGYRNDPLSGAALTTGADARLELGERLSVQLSLNTDFAQVDLDDQRVNLSRFGLFFPEKRDFFLRELEIFLFGRPGEAQLLQTRRIGLHSGQPVPILDGLKLLASPVRWLRLGLLQATTLPGAEQPYALHLVQRTLFELSGGSSVGLMWTHRQSLVERDDRNLVIGIDGTWRSAQGFLFSGFALLSLTGPRAAPVQVAAGGAGTGEFADRPAPGAGADLLWRGLLVRPRLRYAYYHPELRADLGFFRRVGVHEGSASLVVEPRIQRGSVERLTIEGHGRMVGSASEARLLDYAAGGSAGLFFNIGFALGVSGGWLFETIQAAFRSGPGVDIPEGGYGMKHIEAWGATPGVWPVSGRLTLRYADYYGGEQAALSAGLSARPSTLLRLEADAELSRIAFPDERGALYTAVLNGRVGIGFTPRLGLDGYLAWNRVADLVRVQARLRYRYAEGSDLFFVYQQDLSEAGRPLFHLLLIKITVKWP